MTPAARAKLVGILIAVGMLALVPGLVASERVGGVLTVVPLGLTVCLGLWARSRGDLLVTAVAVLLFWMPFQTTLTSLKVAPQEIAVYGICLVCTLFDRLRIRQWVGDLFSSISALMRLAILAFVLACLQSFFRLVHPDALDIINSFHTIVLYPLFFALLTTYVMRSRRAERVIAQAFVAGAAVFAAYALLLRMWGVDSGNGALTGRPGTEGNFLSLNHPDNLALYLVLALAFVPAMFSEALHNYRVGRLNTLRAVIGTVALLLIGITVMLIAIWLTFSPDVALALGLGGVVALVLMALWEQRIPRRIVLGILATGLLIFGGILFMGRAEFFGQNTALITPFGLASTPDVTFRLGLFQQAGQVISAHPLTGIGLQQFATASDVPFSPHNTYLDLWAGTGLYGMLAFIMILVLGFGAACKHVYRLSRTHNTVETLYALGVVIALAASAAEGLTVSFEASMRIAPIVWMLALYANSALRPVRSRPKHATEPTAGAIWNPPTMALSTPQPSTLGATLRHAEKGHAEEIRPPTRDQATVAWRAHSGVVGTDAELESRNTAGEELLQRAPTSFIWNQLYALWFFVTSFLLSIVITRMLRPTEYGIYATLTTIVGTLTFIFAFGLEDTATVFLPKVLTHDGARATGTLIRRLMVGRVLAIGIGGIGLTIGLLFATPYLGQLGITPSNFEGLIGNRVTFGAIFIGLYLVGNSITTLQSAFFSALLKSRIVLVFGGLSQVASIAGVFVLLKMGWGIAGVFAALATVNWLTVIAYLGALRRLLFASGKITSVRGSDVRKLMVSAWLTNITNGALGKQMDIIIMTALAIGPALIGYYNLAYQLGSIVGIVLISGLGGVGMAAMSAALSTGGRARLASMWRANVMLQVLLATPLQIICFVFADQIVTALYGMSYVGATWLLRVFLAFSIFGRLTGGGASQSALYILGKQRSVVVMRWSGLVINVILDVTLIQLYGPMGAMVATGFSQLWVGVMEYLLLRRQLGMVYPLSLVARVTGISISAALLLTWWAPTGIPGLVLEFTLFGVLFVAAFVLLKGDDTSDLTEVVLANPRLQSLVTAVGRYLPQRRPTTVPAE